MSSEQRSPSNPLDAAPDGAAFGLLGERETPLPVHRDGDLVSVITHDLRQPLTAAELNIAAALHYLQRREPLSMEAIAALLDAQGQQRRLRDAIRALHSLSEHRAPVFTTTDTVSIVWDVVRVASAEATAHQVPMRVVVYPPIPSVAADAVLLREALLDITNGALDAVARRAVPGSSVTIEVRPLTESVEIVVTHAGLRPNAALLESWAATLARSVVAGRAATIAVEDGAARDVRIVTRWPIAGDPDARIAATDVPLT
jgi:signal transduction histidine kinase